MLSDPRLLDAVAENPLDLREEIISSWRRCQLVGVAPTGDDVPFRPEFDRPSRLMRAAAPVIDRLSGQLDGGNATIVLADSEAQIIDRRAGGRKLLKALDKAMVCPGFRYAEEFTGTNGIGSALEERRPFLVSGAEHFRENLREFTCIGSPLRHPITGAVEGVLDVTCRVDDTNVLMKPLVLAAVREIESRIYTDASLREQMLLEHFLRASRRSTAAVVSINQDVFIANTAASGLLDASDQVLLWDWACQMLGGRDECSGEIRLARDVVVQAKATKVGDVSRMAGVLVEMRVRPAARLTGAALPHHGPQPAGRRPPAGTGDTLPGRSVAADRLRRDVAAAGDTDLPVLICGEPGTGKLFVARHLHRRHGRGEPFTVFDAFTAHDDPDDWIATLGDRLAQPGTVVLRHLDELPSELTGRVAALVDGGGPARIIGTARARGEHGAGGRVLDHLPVSVTVPPLRYRAEDIADIAPLLLAVRTTRRPVPRLLPGTLCTLMGLDWPGNVRELEVTLTTAVVRSLGSDIAQEHLPPEYRSAGGRSGTSSLQRAERDIVLEALAETRGNKLAAAERLGIARSTLYRKIRVLGIDENRLPTGTSPR
ncbi:sigma-54-dependent Fis family transcriptional regulator [Pseudonocardia hispaniensis]|uniref:Sigma-54-dependent Fis family transcriptional regulator n=1 Tax=Pseudonocardia hispaniensis TaxID=904933 RepID=A0ABW1J130_9PSEU